MRPARALLVILATLGVLAGAVGLAACGGDDSGSAAGAATTVLTTPAATFSDLPTMSEAELPPEGRETLALIDDGGPFPYERDGATFQNREGILPDQRAGYYREYTVPTPGESDRGARRIVTGAAGDRYYTDDHYESFREIVG